MSDNSDILVFSAPANPKSNMPMLNAGMGAISGWLKQEGYEFDQKSLLAETRYRNRYRLKEDWCNLGVFKRDDVISYLRGEENSEIKAEANKLADTLQIDQYDAILLSAKSDMALKFALPILKERAGDKLVIIGGPATMTNDLEIVRLPFVDYGVVGDGEIPLSNILEHELEGEPLENNTGLVYSQGDELVRGEPYQHPMRMKAKPYFRKELLEKMKAISTLDKKLFPYQLGRGCTQDCTFCNYFENQKFQYKDPEKVIRELKQIKEEFDVENFYFTDSNLFNDPEKVADLAERLIEEDIDINWGALAIILPRKQEFFDKLSKSGCKTLLHGIESASNSILHRMRKAQTRDMIESTLEKEANAGITPFGFFIVDYVGETLEEFYETIDFMKNNRDLMGAEAGRLALFKNENMPLYSEQEELGIEVKEPEYEDYIAESFEHSVPYRETEEKSEGSGEKKKKIMQRTADVHLYLRNYGKKHPYAFLKDQISKRYMKDYKDYTWLYA